MLEHQKPLIVHGPLDLVYVASAFQCYPLPTDLVEFVRAVRAPSNLIYDTGHLHSVVGGFKKMKLALYVEEAEARLSKEKGMRTRLSFAEHSQTYAEKSAEHEAAYDALLTGKLYAVLQLLAPEVVRANANKLMLFKSFLAFDLENIRGEPLKDLDGAVVVSVKGKQGKNRGGIDACRELGLDVKFLDGTFCAAFGVQDAARETLEQAAEVVQPIDAYLASTRVECNPVNPRILVDIVQPVTWSAPKWRVRTPPLSSPPNEPASPEGSDGGRPKKSKTAAQRRAAWKSNGNAQSPSPPPPPTRADAATPPPTRAGGAAAAVPVVLLSSGDKGSPGSPDPPLPLVDVDASSEQSLG